MRYATQLFTCIFNLLWLFSSYDLFIEIKNTTIRYILYFRV